MCIEVYGVSVILSFPFSTTQSTDFLEILGDRFLWIVPPSVRRWNPTFLQVCNWEFPTSSFRFQNRGMSNVLARISSRNSWLFRIRNTLFWISSLLSIRYRWTLTRRWFDLQKSSGSMFRSCGSFWIFWRMTEVLGKYSTQTLSAHSESLLDDPISITAWYRIDSDVIWRLCSCILPNFPCNLVQYEWRLPSLSN